MSRYNSPIGGGCPPWLQKDAERRKDMPCREECQGGCPAMMRHTATPRYRYCISCDRWTDGTYAEGGGLCGPGCFNHCEDPVQTATRQAHYMETGEVLEAKRLPEEQQTWQAGGAVLCPVTALLMPGK